MRLYLSRDKIKFRNLLRPIGPNGGFANSAARTWRFASPQFDYYGCTPGVLEDASVLEDIHKEIFIDQKPDYYALAGERERLTEKEFLAQFEAPSEAK